MTTDSNDAGHRPAARRAIWPWFLAGFLLVFVGMLLGIRTGYYTGAAVVECPLWQYYLLELKRNLQWTQTLGPASGSSSYALMTFVEHALVSLAAGAALAGIAWVIRVAGRQAETSELALCS